MFKEYLAEKNISIYKLSKESGVPYSTLNDLVNHKSAVETMKSCQLRSLAKTLEISMDDLYEICLYRQSIRNDECDSPASVTVKHKSYYLTFSKDGKKYEEPIICVKEGTTAVIDTLAEWKLKEKLSEINLEAAYETLLSEKTK